MSEKGWYPGKVLERVANRRKLRPERVEPEQEISPPEEPIIELKPEAGKEPYFLRYNKDEIFKNLIGAEGHLRNAMQKKSEIAKGFLNCVIKHAGDAEGHSDEAISHAAIVEGEEKSEHFLELRDKIKNFRWKIQKNELTPYQAIKEVRQIRHDFEAFNPEYDISKCKSCESIEALMKKAAEQVQAEG